MESWALQQGKLGKQLHLAAGDTGESRSTLSTASPNHSLRTEGSEVKGTSRSLPSHGLPASPVRAAIQAQFASQLRERRRAPGRLRMTHTATEQHTQTRRAHTGHTCVCPLRQSLNRWRLLRLGCRCMVAGQGRDPGNNLGSNFQKATNSSMPGICPRATSPFSLTGEERGGGESEGLRTVSAGHSPPGTVKSRGWDSPSFPPQPLPASLYPLPHSSLQGNSLHGEASVCTAGRGYCTTTHPALVSLRLQGGSALLHPTPLFSSTQIPPFLPPCLSRDVFPSPHLSFLLPCAYPLPWRGGHRSPGNPGACHTPRQAEQAGPCERAMRQGAVRDGGHGLPKAARQSGRRARRCLLAAKARSTVGRTEPPAPARLWFGLFCFKQ